MSLRVGLIGCGRAAERLHLPALSQVEEAALVAVTDPIPERRELIASRAGCPAFDSVESLLGDGASEAIIIATPPEGRRSIIEAAIRAGLPVLVEKPLAATLADGLAVEQLLRARPIPLMVGFNRRYWEPVIRLRPMLRASPTDDAQVDMLMTSDVGEWAPISGVGDLLNDLGSHQLDLLHHLFERRVIAVAAERTGELEMRMRICMEGGTSAECFAAQSSRTNEVIEVRSGGARYAVRMGSIRIQPPAGLGRRLLDFADRAGRRITFGRSPMGRSYERQLLHFVQAVRGDRAPRPGIAAGIAVLRAVEAARASAENNGREVQL